jgi:hypothetical protein
MPAAHTLGKSTGKDNNDMALRMCSMHTYSGRRQNDIFT